MNNQIILEYYNTEFLADDSNNFYNEMIKNYTNIKSTNKTANKKCPRCCSTKTKTSHGQHICLICGDYF